jgi:archaellum biogenesis ATPase FlaH
MLGMTTTTDSITTGVREIAESLGGGIREGSLVLVEGEAKTGKSVLCQYIAYGILHSRETSIAYFTQEYSGVELIAQMGSISLDVKRDFVADRLRVWPLYTGDYIKNSKECLQQLINNMATLPKRFQLIMVDSVSPLITRVDPVIKVDFLQACKELCEQNRSIVLVVDRHIYEGKSLYRAYAMSDYYLKLSTQDSMLDSGQVDTRAVKILSVTKLAGADRRAQGDIRFEIKPGVGIQILPFVKVRV